MKYLKIEKYNALFKRNEEWVQVTEMTKEDLLKLAEAAIEDKDFETDDYNESLLPNPAHQVIYRQINTQLMDLHKRRDTFYSDVDNIYKEAYDKYCKE